MIHLFENEYFNIWSSAVQVTSFDTVAPGYAGIIAGESLKTLQ